MPSARRNLGEVDGTSRPFRLARSAIQKFPCAYELNWRVVAKPRFDGVAVLETRFDLLSSTEMHILI
jgi:hypothetical protein